jgi:carbonic anhydrase/acetyltransferase-like protein (isoleucine patch superfamily)
MPIRALDGRRPAIDPTAFVADSAEVDGEVELGPQVGVWYGAVLRGDIAPIRVGAKSNIQDGAILHTDEGLPCLVGARVTVGHGAILHGCTVEDDVLIGMRATVLSGAVVRRGAIVAAGALVREGQEVPPGTLVAGVPARPVRGVRPEEVERIRRGVEHYLALADVHRRAAAGT